MLPGGDSRISTVISCIALFCAAAAGSARAEAPSDYCARVGVDDTPRPVPEVLADDVNALFGTHLPPHMVVATTVFRCAESRALACEAGANLPCGKANQSRTPGEGAVAWCHAHAGADLPTYVVGHDTLYAWRCDGGTPAPGRQLHSLDARGFISEYWKLLP